jgi:hypothetical protein
MCWTIVLMTLLEAATDDSEASEKREAKAADKAREESVEPGKPIEGGVLAVDRSFETVSDVKKLVQTAFEKLWRESSNWMQDVLTDATDFASHSIPREQELLDKIHHTGSKSAQPLIKPPDNANMFATSVWPSLKSRGWVAELITDGDSAGKTRYVFQRKEVTYITVFKESSRSYSQFTHRVVSFSTIRRIRY